MAEREGIEPTKDHNSLSTVLKTAATTRQASLSMLNDLQDYNIFLFERREKIRWNLTKCKDEFTYTYLSIQAPKIPRASSLQKERKSMAK